MNTKLRGKEMKRFKVLLGGIVSLALLLCLQYTAFAIPCDIGGVGATGSTASFMCQDATGNDFPAPETVNSLDFFGTEDWSYIDKYNVGEGYENGQAYSWTVMGDDGFPSDTGTWSFDMSLWTDFAEAMIVVKTASRFSGYLLSDSHPTSGWWDTGDKDLSHLTLYARGTAPVPEPATMLLFGTGLIGLVGARIRRKRK